MCKALGLAVASDYTYIVIMPRSTSHQLCLLIHYMFYKLCI